MTERMVPITERPNPLTTDLDISEPLAMARLFRQADEQMFTGWGEYPSLNDREMVEKCAELAREVALILKSGEQGVIMMSGAGTSGRFAQLLSRQFNRLLKNAHKPQVFKPLVAGGALALVKAQEGAEDDAEAAVNDMKNVMPDKYERALYFGITCGMSAPYCAGQLDALRKDEKATSVLLAFNPVSSARNVPIEDWSKTFAHVIEENLENERFHILNPVYGPEAVMGSTRMKGGSSTKILLEAIFAVGLEIDGVVAPEEGAKAPAIDDMAAIERRVRVYLRRYRATMHAVYEHMDALSTLITEAGNTLRSGGRVNYLGRDTAGIVGLIDASECVPTFGAAFDDIRGHLNGGWPELLDETRDFSESGGEFRIGLKDFESDKLPNLEKGDLILGICIGEVGPNTRLLLEQVAKTKAKAGLILITAIPTKKDDLPVPPEMAHIINIPSLGFTPGMHNQAEFALKLALNALSTGAHVMIGKVYENRMIDLRISNNKLYFRSLMIIETLTGCSTEKAKSSLHRAVFRKDQLTPEELGAKPSEIIRTATDVPRIVPTALLLAMGDLTLDQAKELLAQDPVPRRVIKAQIEKQQATD